VRSSQSRSGVALALLLALSAGSAASAHRRDEYLQAARIGIGPAHVQLQLDLTPGIAVADRVLAEIDADHDGAISAAEAQRYQGRVLAAVALDVDGVALAPTVTGATFPPLDAVRSGEGTIAMQIDAALPPLSPGPHRLHYRNAHQPEIAVYLANALVPASDRVQVTGQERDADQRSLAIDYTLGPGPVAVPRRSLTSAAAGALAVVAWIGIRRRGRLSPLTRPFRSTE
jgi:hypothetical protein